METNTIIEKQDEIVEKLGTYGLTGKDLAVKFGITEEMGDLLIRVYDKGVREYSIRYWNADQELKDLKKKVGSAATKALNEVYTMLKEVHKD